MTFRSIVTNKTGAIHLHLRAGEMVSSVVECVVREFERAVTMPSLVRVSATPGPPRNQFPSLTAHDPMSNTKTLPGFGFCPRFHGLPILKREEHLPAPRKSVPEGVPRFFPVQICIPLPFSLTLERTTDVQ